MYSTFIHGVETKWFIYVLPPYLTYWPYISIPYGYTCVYSVTNFKYDTYALFINFQCFGSIVPTEPDFYGDNSIRPSLTVIITVFTLILLLNTLFVYFNILIYVYLFYTWRQAIYWISSSLLYFITRVYTLLWECFTVSCSCISFGHRRFSSSSILNMSIKFCRMINMATKRYFLLYDL